MSGKNLWPEDLFATTLEAPVQILKEQAEFLSRSSKRTILGTVKSGRVQPIEYGYRVSEDENAMVMHTLQLEVPDLGGYTFDLLKITHEPRALFPVYLEFALLDHEQEVRADNEEEFREQLAAILSDPKTINLVRTLKAQIADPETLPPEPTSVPTRQTEPEPEDDDIPF